MVTIMICKVIVGDQTIEIIGHGLRVTFEVITAERHEVVIDGTQYEFVYQARQDCWWGYTNTSAQLFAASDEYHEL